MIKVDLHTHSFASLDGGIKPQQYKTILESGQLDCVAITDHNRIDAAQELRKSLGNKVIVGEEIMTTDGELIGLFLTKAIEPHQSALVTAKAIKAQGGLVYVPHPFETVRSGLPQTCLDELVYLIDIVEVHNGRAIFQNLGPKAATWARLNRKVVAASSDAHGYAGLATTYTELASIPTAKTLVKLLETARFSTNRPPLRSLLYPKLNRMSKHLGKKS